MDAVNQAGGEQGGVEARAGLGEQGEDAFFAELVQDLAERDAAGSIRRRLVAGARFGGSTSTRTPLLRSR